MGFLNIGYISKTLTSLKKYKLIIICIALLLVVLSIVMIINRPTTSIYRFNSGLSFTFDLNKWKLIPGSINGDTLEHNSLPVNILLTAAKPNDTSKSLTEIVEERVSLLDKQNIKVTKEAIKINNLDFYKIELTDSGDENVKSDEGSVSFITLNNGTYTTIQIFYKNGTNLKEALDVVSTIQTN